MARMNVSDIAVEVLDDLQHPTDDANDSLRELIATIENMDESDLSSLKSAGVDLDRLKETQELLGRLSTAIENEIEDDEDDEDEDDEEIDEDDDEDPEDGNEEHE